MENYQLWLDKCIKSLNGRKPKLLLQACCAPCSSYVLEYLCKYFDISMFYYNPNIYPPEEYEKRLDELKRLISQMPQTKDVNIIPAKYDYKTFIEMAKGLENLPEGGERCFRCYRLRLNETAKIAKENNFEYFSTTLSISPYKNAQKLNQIGLELQQQYNIKYLCSDFKKHGGYQRSIELSKIYNLYRQNYCGCVFSK